MKKKLYIIISLIVLSILLFTSLGQGSIDITLKELFEGILGIDISNNYEIVRDLRMPRVFIAVLIGANLSIAGVLLQAVIRNPLADPYVTGISSGASLVTVAVMIFMPSIGMMRPILGFLGGVISCGVVYIFAYKKELSPIRIVLVGAAINALFSGLTSMMTTSLGMGATNIQRWLQGSLAAVKWSDVSIILIYSIIGIVLALLLSRNCNILMLGNKNAKSLGINGDVQMIIITGVAVFLSSISTSIGGVISFVGLVVPHICRMIIGSDHKYLIPFSGLVGANLLLLADTLGRVIMKPYEVPVGIIMAIIGAPFFLYILRRSDIK